MCINDLGHYIEFLREEEELLVEHAKSLTTSMAAANVVAEARNEEIYEESCHFEMVLPEWWRAFEVSLAKGLGVRGFHPLFDPFCIWENELSMNISQVKILTKIVRIKKLATTKNKIFVCTMKNTSVHYRMAFSKQFTYDYLLNHLYGEEARKILPLTSCDLSNMEQEQDHVPST
ncbi:Casein kinase I isoform delta-like protein [Hordeum vulgare]|nr:Casein kinase I isoform delta-like protein [Hordeum vulgare]